LYVYASIFSTLTYQLTKGVQKSVKSDSRGQNAKIYSKLSTVMGVTWFLGFGAAHNTIVAYLYIIVNSLQGMNLSETIVFYYAQPVLTIYSCLSYSIRGEPIDILGDFRCKIYLSSGLCRTF
jgi:hypothetical protein